MDKEDTEINKLKADLKANQKRCQTIFIVSIIVFLVAVINLLAQLFLG